MSPPFINKKGYTYIGATCWVCTPRGTSIDVYASPSTNSKVVGILTQGQATSAIQQYKGYYTIYWDNTPNTVGYVLARD